MYSTTSNRVKHSRANGYRSGVEEEVELALREQGLSPEYESEKLPYVLHKKYTPDFKIGDVYIEVKGWWPSAERTKFLAVVMHNPRLRIFVALQRPNTRLSKASRTTYAQWCEKYGIAWCPIPIPKEFLCKWLNGARYTYRAQAPSAPVPMQQLSIPMDQSTALVVNNVTPEEDDHGGKE
jgi:hypothetical protein